MPQHTKKERKKRSVTAGQTTVSGDVGKESGTTQLLSSIPKIQKRLKEHKEAVGPIKDPLQVRAEGAEAKRVTAQAQVDKSNVQDQQQETIIQKQQLDEVEATLNEEQLTGFQAAKKIFFGNNVGPAEPFGGGTSALGLITPAAPATAIGLFGQGAKSLQVAEQAAGIRATGTTAEEIGLITRLEQSAGVIPKPLGRGLEGEAIDRGLLANLGPKELGLIKGGSKIAKDAMKSVSAAFKAGDASLLDTKALAVVLAALGFTGGAAYTLKSIASAYGFGGFQKSEGLQTVGFAAKSALNNGDLEGLDAAIKRQDEILNPAAWKRVTDAIPEINVIGENLDFRKSSEVLFDVYKRERETLASERR